jgi:hypothetical protein
MVNCNNSLTEIGYNFLIINYFYMPKPLPEKLQNKLKQVIRDAAVKEGVTQLDWKAIEKQLGSALNGNPMRLMGDQSLNHSFDRLTDAFSKTQDPVGRAKAVYDEELSLTQLTARIMSTRSPIKDLSGIVDQVVEVLCFHAAGENKEAFIKTMETRDENKKQSQKPDDNRALNEVRNINASVNSSWGSYVTSLGSQAPNSKKAPQFRAICAGEKGMSEGWKAIATPLIDIINLWDKIVDSTRRENIDIEKPDRQANTQKMAEQFVEDSRPLRQQMKDSVNAIPGVEANSSFVTGHMGMIEDRLLVTMSSRTPSRCNLDLKDPKAPQRLSELTREPVLLSDECKEIKSRLAIEKTKPGPVAAEAGELAKGKGGVEEGKNNGVQ